MQTETDTTPQKYTPDPTNLPGPIQCRRIEKAARRLRSAGSGAVILSGVHGDEESQSRAIELVVCGGDGPSARTLELLDAIGERFSWTVSRKNAAAIAKAYVDAIPEAEASRPVRDERRTPEEEAERAAQVAQIHAEREAEQSEHKAERAEVLAGILAKRPPQATALIVAELREDKSDPMTDYFGLIPLPNQAPTSRIGGMNLAELSALTEDQARAYLERIRWPDGAACPHCGDTSVTRLQGKSTRPGTFKCRGCRKQFTVTVGTIFHGSHIPLRKWIMAFHLICASKKGLSALQLQRMLGLGSYKSAWHMAHRVRHAMRSEPLAGMLKGTVEVDEVYLQGRPREKGTGYQTRTDRQKPVVAMVERGGDAYAYATKRVTGDTVKPAIYALVDRGAKIMTDESKVYFGLHHHFQGGHHTTNHKQGEYLRGDVHSNSVESFFSLLTRGVVGAFHHVSFRHLPRYCHEFTFRWNYRKATDGERTMAALKATEGQRLTLLRKKDDDGTPFLTGA